MSLVLTEMKLKDLPWDSHFGMSAPFMIIMWSKERLVEGDGTNGSFPVNIAYMHTPLKETYIAEQIRRVFDDN